MAEVEFFSPEWADAVREALIAGPPEPVRAGKRQEYWDLFDFIKSVYPASWALRCREPAAQLGARPVGAPPNQFVHWSGGTVTDCRIIGPDEPLAATYVRAMNYAGWQALHDGYDAQRTVMYRKMLLEEGNLLEFFKAIYFFVECLSIIGAVPARYPALTTT